MSRTSIDRQPPLRTDDDTPDLDERSRKKVRWNSDNVMEGDKEDFGRIGCAYYNPEDFLIYVLEDTQETAQFDVTRTLLDQVSPDVFLANSKADDKFIDLCGDSMATSGGFFQIRPQKDFRPERGRNNVLSLGLLSDLPEETIDPPDPDASTEPRNAYEFMQRRRSAKGNPTLKRWNASVRVSNFAALDLSPFALGSIGALLDYLIREQALGDLEPEGISGLDVRGIANLSLDKTMQINADALFSLQVFENESHASIHSTKTKEGLSLFGMLDTTRTTLGRSLLRTWLLRPSLSLTVINSRHDAVECFTRPENIDIANVMHGQLNGIKNVPRVLGALRAGKAVLTDWQGLVKVRVNRRWVCRILTDTRRESSLSTLQCFEISLGSSLITALDIAAFREVGGAINKTIDWEESTLLQRVCVRPHIDEELDNRKHLYNGVDAVLSKVAEGISPTVPQDYATSLNVVYFPQLGFLVCVPMLEEWRSGDGIEVLDGWTFQVYYFLPIKLRSHVYFKNDKMHDLDKHLGDLYPLIIDRELEIIQELAESVLPFSEAISDACDICAELDCLLCFAEATSLYNYRRPRMSKENVIKIQQGRPWTHSYQTTSFLVGGAGIDSYPDVHGVDDDLMSEGSTLGNSVLICTGANACGKSVYLKQIALIQLMAQLFRLPPPDDPFGASFVPAESATLGIVDKVFTRIQTRESVSKVQSAFMIDLNQVSLALRNATPHSLILLDEFGKGTAAAGSYGAGLFAGVLRHLLARGSDCPKVIATTHFHELFSTGILEPQKLPITFVHMELTRCDRAVNGLSLESHAARCAELFGVPTHVVQRAQYVTELLSIHELPRLLDEAISEEDQLDMDLASAVCQRFLEWNLETQEASLEDVRARLAQVLGRSGEE
ncbi:DNA mismatch repair protein MutS [Lactarius psammicola]|nr:DNA mismatch repair protein MutS [Lactarius psammicola]